MDIMKLLENVPVKRVINYRETEIKGVSTDSRGVREGDIFVCLVGGKSDGHDYVDIAARKGAVALVTERELPCSLPQYVVKNTRVALAIISGNYYGNPARDLSIVTVVGTNGKTSTADILSQIFRAAGYSSATIGTLGYQVDGKRAEGVLTTPDPLELHRKLAEMREEGVQYVFTEASAHAIHYHKLAGIRAKATVFTNLTQDHLDFFGTMEKYAAAKLSYFRHENTMLGVVNSDDAYGRQLLLEQPVPMISYGIDNPADVFAINVEEDEDGLSFTLNAFDRIEEIHCPLFGRFNVYNLMAAIATAMYLGIGLPLIVRVLACLHTVPGRYEVRYLRGRRVVVDYAHTPDGLENLLRDVRESTKGRVVTVFGCGGNRDRGKRPIMGEIASRYSDYTVITDDNPRDEDELAIADEIRSGVLADSVTEILLDREKAIDRAFDLSSEGDTIVIAGKGHESTMEIKGEKIPYNDHAILEKYTG